MSPLPCPSREELGLYAAGRLTLQAANTLELHLGHCTRCLGRLEEMSVSPDPLLAALRDPIPAPEQPVGMLQDAILAVLAGRHASSAPLTYVVKPGCFINGYRIVEEIGVGGMGRVYRAVHPRLDQEVALKLLRSSAESAELDHRFKAELEALTRMDHPHIARILDGGTTEDGIRYLVMELVRGQSLTAYCDAHRLPIRPRLELFLDVCQAVQHAHQKGIIHRDLKPSNVLITEYDGRPAPKVIDFGIAKVLGRSAESTEVGMLIGTLEYMSPEQAGLDGADVDTRSDVYALGVLLYELLVGETPQKIDTREKPVLELLRGLREDPVRAPSTMLPRDDTKHVAAARGVSVDRLLRQIRGELDWIVLKALDKNRSNRYQTVAAFAEDVQRYLEHKPVHAGPPSRAYRFRKFIGRHQVATVATCLVALSLIGGIIGTSLGWQVAAHERSNAEHERDQKNTALVDLQVQQGKTAAALTAEVLARKQAMKALRSLIDDVVEKQLAQRTQLTDDERRFLWDIQRQYEAFAALPGHDRETAALRGEGYLRLGRIRHLLGNAKEAEPAYREALALYQQLVREEPGNADYRQELASGHHYLGLLVRSLGRMDESEQAFNTALSLRHQLAADFPKRADVRHDMSVGQNSLGIMLFKAGRLPEAEKMFTASMLAQTQLVKEFPEQPRFRLALVQSYVSLATLHRRFGRFKDSEKAYLDALEIQKDLHGQMPGRIDIRRDLATIHNNLGNLFRDAKRWKDAEDSLNEALRLRKLLAAEYPSVPDHRQELASTLSNLGLLYRDTKRFKDAEIAYQEARALRKRLVLDYPKHVDYRLELATSHNNLGVLYLNQSRHEEAQAAFAEALPLRRALVKEYPESPENRNKLAGTLVNLALVCNALGDYAEAKRHLDEGQPHHRAALDANAKDPSYRDFYRKHLQARMRTCAGLDDRDGTVNAAAVYRDLGWEPARNAYDAARALASCIAIVERNSDGSDADRRERVDFYAREAMTLLRVAMMRGFRDAGQISKDTAFAPLRGRADFKKLVADLKVGSP